MMKLKMGALFLVYFLLLQFKLELLYVYVCFVNRERESTLTNAMPPPWGPGSEQIAFDTQPPLYPPPDPG